MSDTSSTERGSEAGPRSVPSAKRHSEDGARSVPSAKRHSEDVARSVPSAKRHSEPVPGWPIGVGVGLLTVAFFAAMPFVLVVLVYVFITIYGFTKGTTLHASTLNVGVVFAGIAAIVAFLLVGLAATISLVGKAMSPERKEKTRDPRRLRRRGSRVGSEGGS